MENKLSSYEVFRKGDSRIQVEPGRPCTMTEITVNVVQYRKEDKMKSFYFNTDTKVKDAKAEICRAFDKKLDPEK